MVTGILDPARFQRTRQRTHPNAATIKSPLGFDSDLPNGNRLTPTHAVKDGKRYSYYVARLCEHRRPFGEGEIGRDND